MGFVQGQRYGTGPLPHDRDIVGIVLDATNHFADLYPTLAGLGRPDGDPDV